MITIFNRRQVYYGYSLTHFNRARAILKQNNIDYTFGVHVTSSAAYLPQEDTLPGVPPANPIYVNRYQLFVHKKDFSKAAYLLQTAQENETYSV